MRKNFGTKSWFYPLPVLVIGTYDENGNPDAMNAAWGGLYDADKVVLCLSAGHKTTRNIQAKGAFTVSFADAAHAVSADLLTSRRSLPAGRICRSRKTSVGGSSLCRRRNGRRNDGTWQIKADKTEHFFKKQTFKFEKPML